MADFQKLGLDRVSQNIARSVNPATGGLTTGNIGVGEVVTVEIAGGGGTATVKPRRTLALIGNVELTATTDTPAWTIEGTTLTVSGVAGAATGTITFWVF